MYLATLAGTHSGLSAFHYLEDFPLPQLFCRVKLSRLLNKRVITTTPDFRELWAYDTELRARQKREGTRTRDTTQHGAAARSVIQSREYHDPTDKIDGIHKSEKKHLL